MPVLRAAVLEENGNALAYTLGSFTRLLEMDVGWESVGSDVLERVRTNPARSNLPSRFLKHGFLH